MPIEDYTQQGHGEPAIDGFTVTPSDDDALTVLPRALYVSGAGNVVVKMFKGTTLTFIGVPAGTFLPLRVTQVLSTGTTATGILGLY